MPSDVTPDVSRFDAFAERAARTVSRAPFFAACCVLVLLWAPSIAVIRDVDLWQLVINTATTIVTFLMVAILENSSARANQATQHKLNALAQAQADLMRHHADQAAPSYRAALYEDALELEQAVGLERRESSA